MIALNCPRMRRFFLLLLILLLAINNGSCWRRRRRRRRAPPRINGAWGGWGAFGACNRNCGGGMKTRHRACNNPSPANGGSGCPGASSNSAPCNTQPCPVNGGWSAWGPYGACSKSCGSGIQARPRTCSNPSPAYGGIGCSGTYSETRGCNMHPCPVNGGWSAWAPYGACSKSCGSGIQARPRTCTNPAPAHGGVGCSGTFSETRGCNMHPCPVNGGWSAWGAYGACDKKCGAGLKTRRRTCNNPAPAHGGSTCPGLSSNASPCNIHPCPVNGGWSAWGAYGACDKKCGAGLKTRRRSCNNPAPAHGGNTCPGLSSNASPCNIQPCPVNGGWSAWGAYESCSKSCGGGSQTRYRHCTSPTPAHGGAYCKGASSETNRCNQQLCPVDGSWGPWGTFSACSKTCGGGVRTKYRHCNNPAPANGGKPCGSRGYKTAACLIKHCPVNGAWREWGAYGSCSKTCGGGTRVRHRQCTAPRPSHGGKDCPGVSSESISCNQQLCTIDGGWSHWGAFSACSKTCGGGVKTQYRYCNNPAPANGGKPCGSRGYKTAACLIKHCPVNGAWREWGAYGSCSKTCGGGTRVRHRQCTAPRPSHGGKDCPGVSSESISCNQQLCAINGGWSHWGAFSACSKTCGGGIKTQYRYCNNPAPANGGKPCASIGYKTAACLIRHCPVDGGWSTWGAYGSCSKTCGGGTKVRRRLCRSPSPAHGGKDCEGASSESIPCNQQLCAIDGGWGPWGAFSACSKTCGGGVKTQYRHCNNPTPANGGKPCSSTGSKTAACLVKYCPVDGGWSAWGVYGSCSKTCGGGTRVRRRLCRSPSPAHGGKDCEGASSESIPCNQQLCAINGGWSHWGAFSACSKTCGGGVKTQHRFCDSPPPSNGGRHCSGEGSKTARCNTQSCPVHGGWSAWGAFDACSKTCGGGQKVRRRSCDNPVPARGGNYCPGNSTNYVPCNTQLCPVDGSWSEWGAYGSCSKSCGGGTKVRQRQCTNPAPAHGGRNCVGSTTELTSCNEHMCPVNGGWSAWGAFEVCSKTCGGGMKIRRRQCNNPAPAHGGDHCPGHNTNSAPCNMQNCPVDGSWSEWGAYGSCSKSCGGGTKVRQRQCTNPAPAHGGRNCVGSTTESTSCNEHMCPVNGGWSAWGAFEGCSKTCGGGMKVRRRQCNNPAPAHGGDHCPGHSTNSATCNMQNCPVKGGWGAWGAFEACSKTCGGGQKVRRRSCDNPAPAHGGSYCPGNSTTSVPCNTHNCPVDGSWSEWGAYESCSKSCGGGIRIRQRQCANPAPAHGGRNCTGSNAESASCNQHMCPVNGGWSSWGAFEACSKTCGGGMKIRRRMCDNPAPSHGGSYCPGNSTNSAPCNRKHCPVDGSWSEWGAYGSCSKSCGGGIRIRQRQCANPAPAHGGRNCTGSNAESTSCNQHMCPVNGGWSAWGAFETCSKTCGGGMKIRHRMCDSPAPSHGGSYCPGNNTESVSCNMQNCPVDGSWSRWGTYGICSKSCGGGTQVRERQCTNPAPAHGGRNCTGSNTESATCNEHMCPVNGGWSAWGAFGPCDKTCGSGMKMQRRMCDNPAPSHGGSYCPGNNTNAVPCNTHHCPVDGSWSAWGSYGECSKTCGRGIKIRHRYCTNPAPARGGRNCTGPRTDSAPCNERMCPVDGAWSAWGAFEPCSKSCGNGTKIHRRSCTDPAPAHGGRNCTGPRSESATCNEHTCPDGTNSPIVVAPDGTMYHLVGCFRKTDGNDHLKDLLITERDNSSHASSGGWIDWHNWDTYMKAFINRCAIKANSRDLSVFGMSYYGECWYSPKVENAFEKYANDMWNSKQCVTDGYRDCLPGDSHCIGKGFGIAVYQIIEDFE